MRVSKVLLAHDTATAMLAAMDKHVVTAGSSQTVAFAREVVGLLECHTAMFMGGVH